MLCVAVAAPAFAEDADQNGGEGVYVAGLDKQSFQAGRTSYGIHARSSVDVSALVQSVRKADSAQTIHDKVNAARQRLYPDEEMILTIEGDAGTAVSLVQTIYWWNNTNSNGYMWYAQYYSTVAMMVINDVIGIYDVYDRANSNWVFRYRVTTGGGATRYNYGSYVLRGFRGISRTSSRADVIMYFFR